MPKTKENAPIAPKMPLHEVFVKLSEQDKKMLFLFSDVHAVSVKIFNEMTKEGQDYVMRVIEETPANSETKK